MRKESIKGCKEGVVSIGCFEHDNNGISIRVRGGFERWLERLAELGVSMADGDIAMLPYLGMKQKLETVENNNLVRLFLGYEADRRIRRGRL